MPWKRGDHVKLVLFPPQLLMADDPKPTDPSPTGPSDPVPTDPKPTVSDPSVTPPSKGDTPETVPYSRFQEQNTQLKEANQRLAELDKAEQERKEAEAIAKGEHEDVIKTLKPKAERAEALEKVLTKTVDDLVEKIPEEKRKLIPNSLSVEDKLAYINDNRDLLLDAEPKKNVGTSSSPSTGDDEITDSTIFTKAQLEDPVFYEKNRDAIIKAMREGRIKD